jgi:hypothetical protein
VTKGTRLAVALLVKLLVIFLILAGLFLAGVVGSPFNFL